MNVDWELLRDQKRVLLLILELGSVDARVFEEQLTGLVNFIDAFQDWSVDQGNATAEEVFGE